MSTKSLSSTLPYLLGIGLAIMPVQRVFFVAVTGLTITLFVSLYITYTHWKEVAKTPKLPLILILLLIVLAIAIPGSTTYAKFYIVGMLAVFLAANILGTKILVPLGIGAIIGGLSVLVTSIASDFVRSGGIYHLTSYNQATGVILLGTIFWRHKYQWITLPIAVLGSLFTGADEAFVIVAVLGFAVLVRGDISKKIIPTVIVAILPFVFLTFQVGTIQNLWATVPATINAVFDGEQATEGTQYEVEANLSNRWNAIVNSFDDVQFFGHGYQPDNVHWTTIHNVPIRILWELGPIGVLAWLGLILYGLTKTSWKYAFVAVIGASLFDHFMWTQLVPWFFLLLGVCTWLPNTSDRMFR